MHDDAQREHIMAEYLGLLRRCECFCPPPEPCGKRWPGECPSRCRVQRVRPIEAEAIRRYLRRDADGRELLSAAARRGVRDTCQECVFLTERDACAVYPVRPLACRTAGLPRHHPYYGRHRNALAKKQGHVITQAVCSDFEGELTDLNRRFCACAAVERRAGRGVALVDVLRGA